MRLTPVSQLLLVLLSILSLTMNRTTSASTDIRLVNGSSFCSGRLEILHNGIWGTVCDDLWDSQDAAVVCRQLGCGNVVQALNQSFGPGSGQIWLDEVQCSGNEAALHNCIVPGWGIQNCVHSEDVGLICGAFYPFGSVAGDTINPADDDGSSSVIPLLSPFLFFGRTYQQIYVNNNGHLTFNQPSSQYVPYSFAAYGGQDIIAGLWTNLDNRERGVVSYHQYTNGSVLTRATLDINNHFPNLTFNASWVFVATWDKAAYYNLTSTETSFQVVLISGSNSSFILMNYGDIAVTGHLVEAGYDTVNSSNYFVIPGSNNGSFISNLKSSSNVNVPGRWAFRVDGGTKSNKDNIIGLQGKLSSFLDLTDSGNIQIVLQQIKQELVKYGLPSSSELKLRKLQKIMP